MAVVASTTYLYVDTNLTQFFVQGTELVDAGPWSSATTYNFPDVVQIGVDQYIALQTNINTPPTGIVDENWSTLAVVEEQSSVINAGSDYFARTLAELALQTAWTGTQLGAAALDAVVIEQGTRAQADQVLTTAIVDETGSRIAADAAIMAFVFGSIAVDLATETGSRIAADNFETGTRSQADQFLQTQIIVEQGTRSQMDQFLYDLILTSSSTSFGSFVDLSGSLAAETASRIAADQQIISIIVTGTNATAAAQSTADAAYALATAGTNSADLRVLRSGDTMTGTLSAPNVYLSHGTQSVASGTLVVNFNSSAYFTAFVTDTVTFDGTNYAEAGYAKTVTYRVFVATSLGTDVPVAFNPSFSAVNGIPSTLGTDKINIITFTSFGTSPNDTVVAYGQT